MRNCERVKGLLVFQTAFTLWTLALYIYLRICPIKFVQDYFSWKCSATRIEPFSFSLETVLILGSPFETLHAKVGGIPTLDLPLELCYHQMLRKDAMPLAFHLRLAM